MYALFDHSFFLILIPWIQWILLGFLACLTGLLFLRLSAEDRAFGVMGLILDSLLLTWDLLIGGFHFGSSHFRIGFELWQQLSFGLGLTCLLFLYSSARRIFSINASLACTAPRSWWLRGPVLAGLAVLSTVVWASAFFATMQWSWWICVPAWLIAIPLGYLLIQSIRHWMSPALDVVESES
jgi:hypothetical protein